MGYQGRYLQPNHAYNNSDVRVLDTFDSTFNGSLTTFNLTEGGAVYRTLNAESLFVKLGGIIQTPRVDYTISNSAGQSQITFTTPPNIGLDCEIRVILGAKGRPQILTDDIDLALTSNPTSPSEGQLYYNTTEDELRVYNGTEWDTAGGGGGLVSADSIDKLLFIHHGGFTADTTIGSPQKFAEIFSHADATIDIDTGVTVDIDDDSLLLVTDKTDFDMDFMANGASGTNLQRATRFDDKVRTSVTSDISLTGIKKVGYAQIPTDLQAEVPFDIENNVTVDVDDGAVLII